MPHSHVSFLIRSLSPSRPLSHCPSLHCAALDTAATPFWLNYFVSGGHLLLCPRSRVLLAFTLLFNFMISLSYWAVQTGLALACLLPQSPECWSRGGPSPAVWDQTQSCRLSPVTRVHAPAPVLRASQPGRAFQGLACRSSCTSGPWHMLGWHLGPCVLHPHAIHRGLQIHLPALCEALCNLLQLCSLGPHDAP